MPETRFPVAQARRFATGALERLGLPPRGTTPEELGTATRAQLAKYGTLIKPNGITAE